MSGQLCELSHRRDEPARTSFHRARISPACRCPPTAPLIGVECGEAVIERNVHAGVLAEDVPNAGYEICS